MTNLEQQLKTRVERVRRILLNKFRVSEEELKKFRELKIELGKNSQYIFGEALIRITPAHIEDYFVIGEEVSHYIHRQLNPIIKSEDGLQIGYVNETVGRYGGLVYAKAEEVTSFTKTKNTGLLIGETPDEAWNNFWHEEGYRRAEKMFELHRESLLSVLARMSTKDAIKFMDRAAPLSFYERNILPILDKLFCTKFPSWTK